MEKAKIAQVITKLEFGGAQLSTLELCRLLNITPRSYDVTLVAGPGGGLDPQVGRYGTFRVRFVSSLVRRISPLKDVRALFCLYRFFKAGNFDIVHTHSSKAGILGRIAAYFAGVPAIVHTVHGFSFFKGQNVFARKLYCWIERVVDRFTGAYIAVCASDIEKALKAGIGDRRKFSLVHDFFDLECGTRLEKDDWKKSMDIVERCRGKKMVLNVSCFKPQKNLEVFVRVARAVKRRVPECVFVLIGDGVGRARLEKLIKDCGLGDCFFMPGWVRDIERVFDAADVFVLTSLFEGLPVSMAQALYRKIPCVCSRVDGVVELLEGANAGCCLEPFDVSGFENGVVKALGGGFDTRFADRKVRDLFNSSRNLLELEKVYASLLVFSGNTGRTGE